MKEWNHYHANSGFNWSKETKTDKTFLCSHRLAQKKEHELQIPPSICGDRNSKVLLNREDWREPVVSDDTKSSSGQAQAEERLFSLSQLFPTRPTSHPVI